MTDTPVQCADCGWSGTHASGPIQGAQCPVCPGPGRIVRSAAASDTDAAYLCEACVDGDHDECNTADCMCIDMEHDNQEQRAYALTDGWVR